MKRRKLKRVEKFANKLREDQTTAEVVFGATLMKHNLWDGCREQWPIGSYIADFCYPAYKLVIEVDGSSHKYREQYDKSRTDKLTDYGYRVIRFTNKQVLDDEDSVVGIIIAALALPKLVVSRNPEADIPTWGKIRVFQKSLTHSAQSFTRKRALRSNPAFVGKITYIPPTKSSI